MHGNGAFKLILAGCAMAWVAFAAPQLQAAKICTTTVGALTNGASTTVNDAVGPDVGNATVTCNAGAYSYSSTTCATALNCTGTPWGTITHGASVTAYSATSVACGGNCSTVAETRTCNNGVLSGSFTNTSCSVAVCVINGTCGGSANSCATGSPSGYAAGSCGGAQTWTCNGTPWGTNASCSIANAACAPTFSVAGMVGGKKCSGTVLATAGYSVCGATVSGSFLDISGCVSLCNSTPGTTCCAYAQTGGGPMFGTWRLCQATNGAPIAQAGGPGPCSTSGGWSAQ